MAEISVGDLMEAVIAVIILLLFLPILSELAVLNGLSIPTPSLDFIVEMVKIGLFALIALAFFNVIAEAF